MYLDQIYCGVIVSPLTDPVSYIGNVVIEINRDATFADPGVPLTPNNLNFGFPDNSTIQVSTSPILMFGGTGIFTTNLLNEMATLDLQGRIIVPPNHNLVIRFTRLSAPGPSVQIFANITYFEVDI